MDLVSVIIPCYNQAQYLEEAVESVLSQTYTNWECIIINDGSPDLTESVGLECCKKDKRIKYFKKDNGGLSSARNYGIKKSIGKYILPLDADDKIGKDYLKFAVQKLQENPQLKVVYCRAELFGAENGEWKLPEFSFITLLLYNTIFCSAIFSRKDYEETNGYNEKLIYGGEDWEFWINLLKSGGEVFKLDSIQFYYRKKALSMHTELVKDKSKSIYTNNIIFKSHFDLYQQFFGDPITVYSKFYKEENEVIIMRKSKMYKLTKMVWRFRKKLKL